MSIIKKVYKAARADKEFVKVQEFMDDGYKMPWLASDKTKFAYATAYGGWLMGKYGATEAKRIYESIKAS